MKNSLYKTGNYEKHTVELTKCPDCATLPGYAHSDGCDVARCPLCGDQRIGCNTHDRSTTPSIWLGFWPGEMECLEYGLYTKLIYRDTGETVSSIPYDIGRSIQWVHADKEDSDARTDLTTLHELPSLMWSRKLQRIVSAEFNSYDK